MKKLLIITIVIIFLGVIMKFYKNRADMEVEAMYEVYYQGMEKTALVYDMNVGFEERGYGNMLVCSDSSSVFIIQLKTDFDAEEFLKLYLDEDGVMETFLPQLRELNYRTLKVITYSNQAILMLDD